MIGLLRKLAIYLCAPIYKLIPQIYNIFYLLSNHKFFDDNTIQEISSNLYILISVVMLFAFSVNILMAIVNPDLLSDKKKGVGAMIKRAMVGIILIILIPFAFSEAYKIQRDVINKNLIEKIVLGINYNTSSSNDSDDKQFNNGGQVIAGQLISSVLHPNIIEEDEEIKISEDISSAYSSMITTDIKDIDYIAQNINITKEKGGHNEDLKWTKADAASYAFAFDGLIAILAGGVCCYLLIIFAMDMAVRIFSLAFLELTSPIIVVSYIGVGDSILKRWAQEVGKTFVDVFVRIACMGFFIFLIGHLDDFLSRIKADSNGISHFGGLDTFFLRALLIIGMLIFIKQIPDFVNKVFGTNLQSKGGIEGRLGQMAVGAKLAQQAWKGIRNAGAIGLAAASLASPLGLAVAGTAATGLIANRLTGGKVASTLRTAGKKVSTAGKTVGAVTKAFTNGNPITAVPNAIKAYKDSEYGKAAQQVISSNKRKRQRENANLNESGSLVNNTLQEAITGYNNLIGEINGMNISNKDKDILKKKANSDLVKAIMSKAKDANNNISDEFDYMIENSRGNVKNHLMKLKTGYKSGDMPLDEIIAQLNTMANRGEIGGSSATKIASNASKIYGINEFAIKEGSELKNFMDEQANGMELLTIDANGNAKLNVTNLGIVAGRAEKYADNVKAEYDAQISKMASQSAKDKQEAEIIDATFGELNAEYARKIQEEHKKHYKYEPSSTNQTYSNSNTQQTTNTGSTANTSAQQTTNTGSTTNTSTQQTTNASSTANTSTQQNINIDMPDMSQYFDGLSKTIQSTSKETNDILNNQLNVQQEVLKQNKDQNTTLNKMYTENKDIKKNIGNVNEKIDEVNGNIKNDDDE